MGQRRRRIVWFLLLRVPELLLATLLAMLIVSITVLVISRYALNVGIGWSDEAARLLFVWIVFFGFAVGVRYRGNIGVEWFVDRLPFSWKRAVRLFQDALIVLFSVVFTWQSIVTLRFSFMQRLPGMEISIAWLYFGILIAGVLMTIYAAVNLWETIHGKTLHAGFIRSEDAVRHVE